MNNLMTRRIVLGMLMALVLAFSVPSIADALTLSRTSGDLQTVNTGQRFTISFLVGVVGAVTKDGYLPGSGNTAQPFYQEGTNVQSGYQAVNETIGGTEQATDDTLAYASDAQLNNDEAIAITVTGGTPGDMTLTSGSTQIWGTGTTPATAAAATLAEANLQTTQNLADLAGNVLHDRRPGRGIVASLSGVVAHGSADTYTITITDVTPDEDFGTGRIRANPITFTIYVVNPTHTDASAIAFDATTDSGNDGIELKSTGDHTIGFSVTGATVDVPVTITATGGGTLFVSGGVGRNTTPVRTLHTSSDASGSVTLRLTSTSTITISHRHYNDRVTYVHGLPTVTITGGNNQEGIAGNRLDQALTVRVTGSGLSLPGIPVIFTEAGRVAALSTTGSDGTFMPVPGTTVYTTSAGGVWDPGATAFTRTATLTSPTGIGVNAAVQTDENGVASVYYAFHAGDTTGQIAYVDATVVGVAPAMRLSWMSLAVPVYRR